MSTFTEWNGPMAARGPSTKDVLALIEAYNSLNATLAKHLAGTATDDVHGFKTTLVAAVAETEAALKELIGTKADSDDVASLAEAVASSAESIAYEAARAQEAEAALNSAVVSESSRALAAEEEVNGAIDELEAALGSFKEAYLANASQIAYDGDATTTIAGIVSATEHFIGVMKVRRFHDIVEWRTFNAQYAGTGISDATTGTNGVYILGRMSDEWIPDMGFEDKSAPKTARAHIKYINSRPFDLMVDMAATSAEEGSLTCLASFEKPWTLDDPADAWEDMALHLLTNTDATGHVHVFLAISAKGLSGQSTTFHVAGENFIPGGTVNGVSSRIAFTRVKQGFNGNRANLDDLRVEALNDAYGKIILKVEYSNDIVGVKHKDLYIADPSYEGVYFLRRPSVIYTPSEDYEDTASEIAPVLTSLDLDAVSSGGSLKGIIVFWPQWEDAEAGGKTFKKAINVPEGWLACDGSEVSSEEYPGLAEKLGQSGGTLELPLIDYAIIRVADLFEGIDLKEESTSIRVLTHKELTEAIMNVQGNVEAEAEERIAADEALQANIDAEAQARQEADEALQASLDAETQARQEADAALQSGLDAEAQARQDTDESLQEQLDAEAAEREAADDALEQKVETETVNRQNADTALQSAVDAETTARREADTQLQSAIDAEAVSRQNADTALQSAIDAETTARREADTALQAQIDSETANRLSIDAAQQLAISTLDATKAEVFEGSKEEFEAAKDSLEDGTIVLSDDDLNH